MMDEDSHRTVDPHHAVWTDHGAHQADVEVHPDVVHHQEECHPDVDLHHDECHLVAVHQIGADQEVIQDVDHHQRETDHHHQEMMLQLKMDGKLQSNESKFIMNCYIMTIT